MTEIPDPKGYVKVRDTYQTESYDDVYAVGIAAQWTCPGRPPTRSGFPRRACRPSRWRTWRLRTSPLRSRADNAGPQGLPKTGPTRRPSTLKAAGLRGSTHRSVECL